MGKLLLGGAVAPCLQPSKANNIVLPRSHLNDHGVLSMFWFICEVWFLCAGVPNQHLKKIKETMRKSADSKKYRALGTKGKESTCFCAWMNTASLIPM